MNPHTEQPRRQGRQRARHWWWRLSTALGLALGLGTPALAFAQTGTEQTGSEASTAPPEGERGSSGVSESTSSSPARTGALDSSQTSFQPGSGQPARQPEAAAQSQFQPAAGPVLRTQPERFSQGAFQPGSD